VIGDQELVFIRRFLQQLESLPAIVNHIHVVPGFFENEGDGGGGGCLVISQQDMKRICKFSHLRRCEVVYPRTANLQSPAQAHYTPIVIPWAGIAGEFQVPRTKSQ